MATGSEETKLAENDLEEEINSLTEGQKKTYDALVEKDIKNVTKSQLVKAAQEFGVDVDAAVKYLTTHDPDAGDQVAEPDFLTEVKHGDKVESQDQRLVVNDGITNVLGIIAAYVCAIVFEQWYLFGITGANWYWASQLFWAKYFKFLTVTGDDKQLKLRWNVAEDSTSTWLTRTLEYDQFGDTPIKSFSRKAGCGSGETCSSNTLTVSGNGCKCFPCTVCKVQDIIEFELKESFHFNCCSGGKREGCCAKACGCFDQQVSIIRVSTDDLQNLGDFLVGKGVNEDGQKTADI